MRTFYLGLIFIALTLSCSETVASEPWSFRRIDRPNVPPQVTGKTSGNPIDHFILKSLQDAGLKAAPQASRETLIRRASFDLIGLPPSPAEITDFISDKSPLAYERLVDRLLSSPHYGERWARSWMDAVHYAETHGHDQDRIRTNAWPYRDYLIRSFNQDKPYPRFVQEQVAGDILFPTDPQAAVAPGFLATGPWDESSLRDIREDTVDRQVGRYLDRDDIVTTVMQTFTSTTVQCARCHDHKFDPISQRDYYALQAVFAGIDKGIRPYDEDPVLHLKRTALRKKLRLLDSGDVSLLGSGETLQAVNDLEAEFKERLRTPASGDAPVGGKDDKSAQKKTTPEWEKILALPTTGRTPEQKEILARQALRQQINRQLEKLPPPLLVYAGANDFLPDGGHKPPLKPRVVHVLRRGEISKPVEEAFPGALSGIQDLPSRFSAVDGINEGERRSALAQWITARNNPLSWRSIVNRIWHHHFGRGIVETVNDFGRMGAAPIHPELLDWLAVWFRDEAQGSLKALHRLIVTSDTYRQSTVASSEMLEKDPSNKLLGRMNRLRLDAEQIRDAVLQLSGRLDRRMGGESDRQFDLKPGIHVTPKVDYTRFDVDSGIAKRRSVYRFLFRTLPDPVMDALDCPAGDQLAPVRGNSVTVQQALALWNSAFMLRYAAHFAEKLEAQHPDLQSQVLAAGLESWGRRPTSEELAMLAGHAKKHGLASVCRLLINSNEFVFLN